MIKRKLTDIAEMINSSEAIGKDTSVRGVSIDSRTIVPGNLYVPIIGDKFNGHEFAYDAIKNGASSLLWQKDQPSPPKDIPLLLVEDTLAALQMLAKSYRDQLSLKVIGITGSNGKTTTKDMVSSVLSTTYRVHKTEGNLNNHIGLPLTILRLDEKTEVAVLEMGMSGRGEIALLSNIARPDFAIITNIGESHLLDLGSREGIAEAKLEITDGLTDNGLLIYNGDEPLLNQHHKCKSLATITFGNEASNDYYPLTVVQRSEGTHFTLNSSASTFYIPILGKHNVLNATAAICVAKTLQVTEKKIVQGLQNLSMTTMRMELLDGRNGSKIINDAYNASPTSMRAAIQLIRDLEGYGKKIVVLGDMLELGEREVDFHKEIGTLLTENVADYVYTYGKLGAHISSEAKGNYQNQMCVKAFFDKQELIFALKKIVGEDSVVLVKGSRGMRLEEVVKALT